MEIIVFPDRSEKWRWTMRANNHKIIATSHESFASKSNALRAANKVLKDFGKNGIKIIVLR